MGRANVFTCGVPNMPMETAWKQWSGNVLKRGLRIGGAVAVAGSTIRLGLSTPVGSGLKSSFSGGTLQRSKRSAQENTSKTSKSKTPKVSITQGLIGLNALLFGAQILTKDLLTLWGVKVNDLIMAGQWWRLVTPAFLHGNLVHLAVNCYSLYNLAPLAESIGGGKRLLAVYLAAGVIGNVASFYGSAAPSLGASGAVFGVGGALAMYFWMNKDVFGRKRADFAVRQLSSTLLINLLYGLANPRIDNWGHIGGLVGGAAVALLLGPKFQLMFVEGKRGEYLVDRPPIPWFKFPPRRLS